jgi:LysM repeat protein
MNINNCLQPRNFLLNKIFIKIYRGYFMAIYEVKSGDTLWKIAQQHNTTVAAICRDNDIKNPNSIFIGQRFNIGTSTVPESIRRPESVQCHVPSPVRQPETPVHTVRPGENLSSIAQQYGLTVQELCEQNNYSLSDAYRLQIGHRFTIDRTPAVVREQEYQTILCGLDDIRASRYGLQKTYTVQQGDTLSQIVAAARAYNPNLTVGHVQAVNNLANPNSLRIGQRLEIPQMPNETKEQIIPIARQVARLHGVDESLVLAVIHKETGGTFNPRSTSPALAMGLMQIMPSVAKDFGLQNPYDIVGNIDAGVRHLKYMLERFNGDVDLALAGYNAGPTNAATRGKDWSKYSRETREYVPDIRNLMQNYSRYTSPAKAA